MSLKKKIALSFFISATIIAILAIFEYVNFIEIRKEIRHLEITDTIRSHSLQLRRHEKNFFLYPLKADEESMAIYKYLSEMDAILSNNLIIDRAGKLSHLRERISEYRLRFHMIESLIKELSDEFGSARSTYAKYRDFYPLIELTFREHPLQAAELLKKVFLLPSDHQLIKGLVALDLEINTLRKNGEDILVYSKELDRIARTNAEGVIQTSQVAILVFFPLFFLSGIGTLFLISKNVVSRLRLLIDVVERTGKGLFSQVAFPSEKWGSDEVGVLIQKFNNMEEQLGQREEELERKNRELLQTRKLAAIGTLASGVAHELNNPLNNIYISAQILERESTESCSPMVKETLNDIVGQTIRVKRIVGDLLEFARGREPQFREVDLNELIMGAYKLVSTTANAQNINFTFDAEPGGTVVNADPEQMERVFINLFTNAVDAMSHPKKSDGFLGTPAPEGDLTVKLESKESLVKIKISDTGRGMPADSVEMIFEPFYTTKDKGTGLGLAIVFNIIKKHGGEISAESEEGKGTTFTITLPSGKAGHEL
ncbi:MAG: hypothetical protein HY099_02155 [Nitrospirae bacterium]|nr:hypothetical protein [Nitrospirota bacterium]